MAKDIITDLKDGMKEMVKDELAKVTQAIEADKLPPIPMRPMKVMRKVYEIARNHQLTADEFAVLLEFQGTMGTAEGVEMLEEYKRYLEEQ
ncbi:MAG: hypothetical protein IJE81_01915 [Oscillospiraceae bacterium]|nr:hypothetical protein [Oscillospiraceae bacterium]MBQ7129806.1 hypothetical protein [Oscillospiraceae bacterium]